RRPTAWLLVAHAIRSVASAAAPRMTSAYSAVVWPSSVDATRLTNDACKRRNTLRTSGSGPGGPIEGGSAARCCELGARETDQQRRDHREQTEGRKHEEHEREEEAYRHGTRARLGHASRRGTLFGREACELLRHRRSGAIGDGERAR